MSTKKADKTELFERMAVSKAIISLAIPTVISQVITVVYNIADTFFVGRMNDPDQVAAATLCMPPFLVLTSLANLFGIGGASLISRSLGCGDREKGTKSACFSMWTAGGIALVYGMLLFIFRSPVLHMLGANDQTYGFCADYIFWTITVGGIPTVLSACFSHMVRSEGYSKEASFGVAMGGILNILLDPLFIFPLKLGVKGAAIATMLSNLAAMVYYIILIAKRRSVSVIRFSPKYYPGSAEIPKEIVLVGLPSCLIMFMGTISNTVLNKLVVSYSNNAIAGMGIAKKVDTLAFAFTNGMTQGVLPLVAYNYASGDHERMRKAAKLAFLYAFCLAAACGVLLFTCAVPILKAFIEDAQTVAYGQHFLRIICVTVPLTAITNMSITMFQAVGQKKRPMLLSLLRKGCLDIPFMFIMRALLGMNGIPYATPIADAIAMTVALILFIPFWKKLE